jgi:hypothetical protein
LALAWENQFLSSLASLPLQVPQNAPTLFSMAVKFQHGGRISAWRSKLSLVMDKIQCSGQIDGWVHKGLNSLIILVVWEIWKHRKACVFDNKRPNIQEVVRAVSSEGGLWCSAGASKLQELVLRSLPAGA